MLEVLILYGIFCLTTAIFFLIKNVLPTLVQLEIEDPSNVLLEHRYSAYMVFLVIGILGAPILFLCIMIPSVSKQFDFALLNSLKDAK